MRRLLRRPLLLAVFTCSAATPALAQGDTCDVAEPIAATGSYPVDLSSNTASGAEAGAPCSTPSDLTTLVDGYYQFTAPVDGIYTFSLSASPSTIVRNIVGEGTGCSTTCIGVSGTFPIDVFDVVAGTPFVIRCATVDPTATHTLVIEFVDDPCVAVPPDAYEPNNTCLEASPLPLMSTTGLEVCYEDPDFYSLIVPPSTMVRIDPDGPTATRITTSLYDTNCNLLGMVNFGSAQSYVNQSAQPQELRLGIEYRDVGTNLGTSYSLSITTSPDVCAGEMDDGFEENDTCETAIPLGLGFYTDLLTTPTDSDFYEITVPAITAWSVRTFERGLGDLRVKRYSTACGSPNSVSGNSAILNNTDGAPRTFIVEVKATNQGTQCARYDMALFEGNIGICDTPGGDQFEPNNTCLTAAPVLPGTYFGLNVLASDEDFYEALVESGERLQIDLFDNALGADVDLEVFLPDCSLYRYFDADSALYVNDTTGPQIIRFSVFGDRSVNPSCVRYAMDVRIDADDCRTVPDDTFEPVDSCVDAVLLGDGTFPGLELRACDDDFFAVDVAPGGTLAVALQLERTDLIAWVFLQTAGPGCGTFDTEFALGNMLSWNSGAGDSTTFWTNPSALPSRVIVQLATTFLEPGVSVGYDLTISGAMGPSGDAGIEYCAAVPNSTGSAGRTQAIGSRIATDELLRLRSTSLPPNATGFYLVSDVRDVILMPGGSEGTLCLGGTIGRFVGPGQVLNSEARGEFALDIDLTQIPRGTGFVAAAAGDVWNFTAWHRDVGALGATSNFTTAVEVTYL